MSSLSAASKAILKFRACTKKFLVTTNTILFTDFAKLIHLAAQIFSLECTKTVADPVCVIERTVWDLVGNEVVEDGTECQTIGETPAKILDENVLRKKQCPS